MAAEATPESDEPLTDALLEEIEAVAVELAHLAGAEIDSALGREIVVEYKSASKKGNVEPTNPVSEVDHAVEALVRERLALRFPGHGIIGEEVELQPDPTRDFVWVIDPVDGTTNFVNGFPLFAASIGVLHRGVPVAGAIWCSTGHELRSGVYHARAGGPLRF
ncbi:MAG TPA: inositol monophosphatase family protein, partial [Dehalococcoidia bacterium]|nr:inositol monophosphatase family protein [Dehalococcoidia bacterium]